MMADMESVDEYVFPLGVNAEVGFETSVACSRCSNRPFVGGLTF